MTRSVVPGLSLDMTEVVLIHHTNCAQNTPQQRWQTLGVVSVVTCSDSTRFSHACDSGQVSDVLCPYIWSCI